MSIHCSITTPEKLVYEGTARMVVVPSSDGELGILPNHAALMSLLGVGELRLEAENGGQSSFFVSGGFVQVADDAVNVLATEAEAAGDLGNPVPGGNGCHEFDPGQLIPERRSTLRPAAFR